LNAANMQECSEAVLRTVLLFALGLIAACAEPRDYLRDADPVNADLTIHVVVENPLGSNEKWEVQSDGRLAQAHAGGEPITTHAPWPANAGMIPRTLLSKELGGDGEPVDVLVLGPKIARGSLVRARPIGLLRLLDRLERDDKVIAVVPGTELGDVKNIDDLESRFPEWITRLEAWYESSDRAAFDLQGFGSRGAANRLIGECALTFEALEKDGQLPPWLE
jgi:inorganic pyrophosphatase